MASAAIRRGAGVVDPQGFIETGYPVSYDLDLACPFDLLGPFNGATWPAVTPDLAGNPPVARRLYEEGSAQALAAPPEHYGVRPMNAMSLVWTSASSGTSTRGP